MINTDIDKEGRQTNENYLLPPPAGEFHPRRNIR